MSDDDVDEETKIAIALSLTNVTDVGDEMGHAALITRIQTNSHQLENTKIKVIDDITTKKFRYVERRKNQWYVKWDEASELSKEQYLILQLHSDERLEEYKREGLYLAVRALLIDDVKNCRFNMVTPNGLPDSYGYAVDGQKAVTWILSILGYLGANCATALHDFLKKDLMDGNFNYFKNTNQCYQINYEKLTKDVRSGVISDLNIECLKNRGKNNEFNNKTGLYHKICDDPKFTPEVRQLLMEDIMKDKMQFFLESESGYAVNMEEVHKALGVTAKDYLIQRIQEDDDLDAEEQALMVDDVQNNRNELVTPLPDGQGYRVNKGLARYRLLVSGVSQDVKKTATNTSKNTQDKDGKKNRNGPGSMSTPSGHSGSMPKLARPPSTPCQFDLAYLYSKPVDENKPLLIDNEKQLLESCIDKAGKKISFVTEVLTLINFCEVFEKGLRVLHLSCHAKLTADGAISLAFERENGFQNDLSSEKVSKLVASRVLSNLRSLQLIFISACYSEVMGKIFVDANVPHVICIEKQTTIRDDAALRFTQVFYDNLLGKNKTVKESFDIARFHVMSDPSMGSESEKFLLLPKDSPAHATTRLFANVEKGDAIDATRTTKTNVLQDKRFKMIGRQELIAIAVKKLTANGLVLMYGQPKIGKTVLAKHVATFLLERKTYDGVYFVDLSNDTCACQIRQSLAESLTEEHSSSLSASTNLDAVGKNNVKKCLLVLDGVQTCIESSVLHSVIDILLKSRKFDFIITSCSENCVSFTSNPYRLKVEHLVMGDTVDLFIAYAARSLQSADLQNPPSDMKHFVNSLFNENRELFMHLSKQVPHITVRAAQQLTDQKNNRVHMKDLLLLLPKFISESQTDINETELALKVATCGVCLRKASTSEVVPAAPEFAPVHTRPFCQDIIPSSSGLNLSVPQELFSPIVSSLVKKSPDSYLRTEQLGMPTKSPTIVEPPLETAPRVQVLQKDAEDKQQFLDIMSKTLTSAKEELWRIIDAMKVAEASWEHAKSSKSSEAEIDFKLEDYMTWRKVWRTNQAIVESTQRSIMIAHNSHASSLFMGYGKCLMNCEQKCQEFDRNDPSCATICWCGHHRGQHENENRTPLSSSRTLLSSSRTP